MHFVPPVPNNVSWLQPLPVLVCSKKFGKTSARDTHSMQTMTYHAQARTHHIFGTMTTRMMHASGVHLMASCHASVVVVQPLLDPIGSLDRCPTGETVAATIAGTIWFCPGVLRYRTRYQCVLHRIKHLWHSGLSRLDWTLPATS